MVPISTIPLIFLIISLPILLSSLVKNKSRAKSSKNKRRPPGPWSLPLVGSIHRMITSQPQAALRDLAAKHGPAVMYLRLGQAEYVVVSSASAAQEVLQAKDISFASRPRLLGPEMICYGCTDIGFAPYGPYWRFLRKVAVLELLSARKVRQFAGIRDSETMSLVRDLCVSGGSGEPVNLGRLITSCTNYITGLATFGDRCSSERREQFLSAMAVVTSTSLGFCVSDLFPSLWFLDTVTGLRGRLRRASEQLDDVFNKIISEHEERQRKKDKNNTDQGEDDILSVLLRIRDDDDSEREFSFTNTNIKAIIVDLFIAGTETTASVAEWLMSELVRHPEAMAKAQEEVRRVFRNTNPRDHESCLDQLHYTNMVIKETLRLYPPVPLLLPRLCRETCDVGRFEVAEGTRVIVNAWAINRNPEYWVDADEFRPERFEGSAVDYNGSQFEYLPFGSGRRMCPGMSFGIVNLQIIVARLLYYFDWQLPTGMAPADLDMEMIVGATARRKNQLHLVATPYQAVHLDI